MTCPMCLSRVSSCRVHCTIAVNSCRPRVCLLAPRPSGKTIKAPGITQTAISISTGSKSYQSDILFHQDCAHVFENNKVDIHARTFFICNFHNLIKHLRYRTSPKFWILLISSLFFFFLFILCALFLSSVSSPSVNNPGTTWKKKHWVNHLTIDAWNTHVSYVTRDLFMITAVGYATACCNFASISCQLSLFFMYLKIGRNAICS
jgi:hypothetical protein